MSDDKLNKILQIPQNILNEFKNFNKQKINKLFINKWLNLYPEYKLILTNILKDDLIERYEIFNE